MATQTSSLPRSISMNLHQGLRLQDRPPRTTSRRNAPKSEIPSRTMKIFTPKKPRMMPKPQFWSKASERPRTPKRSPSRHALSKNRNRPVSPPVLQDESFPKPYVHEDNTTPQMSKPKVTPRTVTPARPATPRSTFPKTTKPNNFRAKPIFNPRPKHRNVSSFKLLKNSTPIQTRLFQSRCLNLLPESLGGKPGSPKQVDTTKLYETLGVSEFIYWSQT